MYSLSWQGQHFESIQMKIQGYHMLPYKRTKHCMGFQRVGMLSQNHKVFNGSTIFLDNGNISNHLKRNFHVSIVWAFKKKHMLSTYPWQVHVFYVYLYMYVCVRIDDLIEVIPWPLALHISYHDNVRHVQKVISWKRSPQVYILVWRCKIYHPSRIKLKINDFKT